MWRGCLCHQSDQWRSAVGSVTVCHRTSEGPPSGLLRFAIGSVKVRRRVCYCSPSDQWRSAVGSVTVRHRTSDGWPSVCDGLPLDQWRFAVGSVTVRHRTSDGSPSGLSRFAIGPVTVHHLVCDCSPSDQWRSAVGSPEMADPHGHRPKQGHRSSAHARALAEQKRQRSLRQTPAYKEQHIWAPFRLIGILTSFIAFSLIIFAICSSHWLITTGQWNHSTQPDTLTQCWFNAGQRRRPNIRPALGQRIVLRGLVKLKKSKNHFFLKRLETTQKTHKISQKNNNPSWNLTHPPTSEFFSDFWIFLPWQNHLDQYFITVFTWTIFSYYSCVLNKFDTLAQVLLTDFVSLLYT